MPRKAKTDVVKPVSEVKVEEPAVQVEEAAVKTEQPEAAPKAKAASRAKAAPKTKAAPKAKAEAAPKTAAETIMIQSGGAEWDLSVLKEKAITAYIAEGHRRGRISDLTLYVKPEERKVYYVINGKTTGSVDFD